MAYSVLTTPAYIMPNVPRPVFRFTDDASVVMATQSADPRYTSSSGGGGSSVTDALLTEGSDFMITENDDNLQFEE